MFSPFAPPATVDFAITPSGVHTLPDSYELDDDGETLRDKGRKRKEAETVDGKEYGWNGVNGDGAQEGEGDKYGEIIDDFGDLPGEFWEVGWDGRETLAEGVTT